MYIKVEILFTAICQMSVASRIYEKQGFYIFDFLDQNRQKISYLKFQDNCASGLRYI